MTKKELMQKWGDLSRPLKNDLNDVIKHEVAKAKEQSEKPSSQVKLDNSFDRERFERFLCAVVSSGHNDNFEADLNDAKYLYEQLELYYYNN